MRAHQNLPKTTPSNSQTPAIRQHATQPNPQNPATRSTQHVSTKALNPKIRIRNTNLKTWKARTDHLHATLSYQVSNIVHNIVPTPRNRQITISASDSNPPLNICAQPNPQQCKQHNYYPPQTHSHMVCPVHHKAITLLQNPQPRSPKIQRPESPNPPHPSGSHPAKSNHTFPPEIRLGNKYHQVPKLVPAKTHPSFRANTPRSAQITLPPNLQAKANLECPSEIHTVNKYTVKSPNPNHESYNRYTRSSTKNQTASSSKNPKIQYLGAHNEPQVIQSRTRSECTDNKFTTKFLNLRNHLSHNCHAQETIPGKFASQDPLLWDPRLEPHPSHTAFALSQANTAEIRRHCKPALKLKPKATINANRNSGAEIKRKIRGLCPQPKPLAKTAKHKKSETTTCKHQNKPTLSKHSVNRKPPVKKTHKRIQHALRHTHSKPERLSLPQFTHHHQCPQHNHKTVKSARKHNNPITRNAVLTTDFVLQNENHLRYLPILKSQHLRTHVATTNRTTNEKPETTIFNETSVLMKYRTVTQSKTHKNKPSNNAETNSVKQSNHLSKYPHPRKPESEHRLQKGKPTVSNKPPAQCLPACLNVKVNTLTSVIHKQTDHPQTESSNPKKHRATKCNCQCQTVATNQTI
eukprot:gene13136-8982_t